MIRLYSNGSHVCYYYSQDGQFVNVTAHIKSNSGQPIHLWLLENMNDDDDKIKCDMSHAQLNQSNNIKRKLSEMELSIK